MKENPSVIGFYFVYTKVNPRSKNSPNIAHWEGDKMLQHWHTVGGLIEGDNRIRDGVVLDWDGPLVTTPVTTPATQDDELPLRQIQLQIGEWSRRNFGEQVSKATDQTLGSLAPLLGMVEEVGELTHCTLKRHQGIRGFDDSQKYKDARDDSIADLMVYLCDYCSREGIDAIATLNTVWKKVRLRDWEQNPINAHAVAEGISVETQLEKQPSSNV